VIRTNIIHDFSKARAFAASILHAQPLWREQLPCRLSAVTLACSSMMGARKSRQNRPRFRR
jgi:hypothetical protein